MKLATKQQIIAASAFIASSAYAFTSAPRHVINTRNVIVADNIPRFMSAEPTVEEKGETKLVVDDAKKVGNEPQEKATAANEKAPATVAQVPTAAAQKKKPKKKVVKKKAAHPDGVFSPAVRFASIVMGDELLVNVRKKVINMHSDTIRGFVDTSSSDFGDAVLRSMFKFADKDGNGTIDKEELSSALQSLGFSWIDDKQAGIIFKKTDKDKNGVIDMDEWMEAAPMTLKTNLIRLAKQNGEEMGLLTAPVKREKPEEKKEVPKKMKKEVSKKDSGSIISPVVLFTKEVMEDKAMKDAIEKVNNKESDTIKTFVDSSSTEFGDAVLRGLFRFVDSDEKGAIDENDLAEALQSIGFSGKQASSIFKKTDEEESGTIDMEEWVTSAPETLRENLIKFAQRNVEVDFYRNK